MRFLKYLFFKYYYWQERMGNHNSSFMVILFMSFIFMLYFFDAIMLSTVLFDKTILNMSKWMALVVLGVPLLAFYFLLVYRSKDKVILKEYETEWMGKKSFPAILIGILPFILYIVSMVLMTSHD